MLTRRIRWMVRNFPENGMKFLLENPRNVEELLTLTGSALIDSLDWSRAALDRTTYVQRDYRHVEADVVLRVPMRATRGRQTGRQVLLYILIEQQSEPERWMLLRVHDYVIQIYKSQLRDLQRRRRDSTERVQPVLPVVFYTGEQSWPGLGSFADLVEQSSRFQPVLPVLSPLFLNLDTFPAARLEAEGGFFGWVLRVIQERTARSTAFGETLERAVAALEAMTTVERGRWLELLSYIHALVYHGREPAEHSKLQERIAESVHSDPHRKEVVGMGKTIADSLIERGRKTEAVTSRRETLLELIRERFGPPSHEVEQAIKTTKDVTKLKHWLKNFARAETISDLGIVED